jgi:YD repeat-containing protein
MSDREKAGLHGPVRSCVEESIFPGNIKHLTTREYSPDGKILILTARVGNSDGTEWITTQTYDATGRLTETISGNSREPSLESVCTYDGAGRLLNITNSPSEGDRIDFHFDEQGRKTATQRFDSKTFERAQKTAYAVSAWDAAGSGAGVPLGGSIVSIYDGHDEPTEARVLDPAGQTLTRFVRTFDANGRTVEESQERENPGLMFAKMFSAEDGAELDDNRMEALNKGAKTIFSGLRGTGTTYTYDAQGRIVESRERNFIFEKSTTILYNARGDKSEERTAITNNCVFPPGVSISIDENGSLVPEQSQAGESSSAGFPSEDSKLLYSYQYDSYGNWVEQTVIHDSRPDKPLSVNRRRLTYY